MHKRVLTIISIFASCLFIAFNFTVAVPVSEELPQRVSFIAVGDNLLHDALISDAKAEGGFDFSPMYEAVREKVAAADMAFINEEGLFAGEACGFSGYPFFNSPDAAGRALVNVGFNIIGHANNHALDYGEEGIRRTIAFWKEQSESVLLTGIYESDEERKLVKVIKKDGIKIAVLSYTDTTNGIVLPKEKDYLVATTDTKKMEKELEQARKSADVLVVFMHWGEEYASHPSERQRSLAKFLAERGADLIVGSHPHVLQPTEWIDTSGGKRTLVAYSLGNFISCQHKKETMLGGMLSLAFEKMENGEVSITAPTILPIVTHFNGQVRGFKVYPLAEYTDDLAAGHGISRYDGAVSINYFQNLAKEVLG